MTHMANRFSTCFPPWMTSSYSIRTRGLIVEAVDWLLRAHEVWGKHKNDSLYKYSNTTFFSRFTLTFLFLSDLEMFFYRCTKPHRHSRNIVDSLRHLVSILYLLTPFSADPGRNCTCQGGALLDLIAKNQEKITKNSKSFLVLQERRGRALPWQWNPKRCNWLIQHLRFSDYE